METEYSYLLHLLGAYLRGEEPEVSENVDWIKLMRLAQIHNVVGILGYMGRKYPICPDEKLNTTLRGLCMNTIAVFARRNAMAETVVAELEKAGIDHILMKGFVLRDLYPVPELRTFNDIDIVIRPEDRQRSHALMMAQGFQLHTDWEPVYSYNRGEELYEIHTDIMEIDVSDRADYRGYFGQMWQYARQVTEHSYRFTPEFHFLYLLTHIAKHVVGSGAGIRMYLDVAVFIQHFGAELDWKFIRQELEKLKLADFANIVLVLVQSVFRVNSPIPLEPVEDRVLQDFVDFTMTGGIFGRVGRDSGTLSLQKQSREKGEISRVGTFLKRLFPAAKTIQSRYTYLQDKPWLLPAAWVHRLFKTKDSWHQHTEEMQNILSADKENVQRINRLYRQIGL